MDDLFDINKILEQCRQKNLYEQIDSEIVKNIYKNDSKKIKSIKSNDDVISLLLDLLGDFFEYDELCMSYQVDFLSFKQVTSLQLPLEDAPTVIAIVDLNAQACIDVVELDGPLSREEFEDFAKDYYSKL